MKNENKKIVLPEVKLFDLGIEKYNEMYTLIHKCESENEYGCMPFDIVKFCNEDECFKGNLTDGVDFIMGERLGLNTDEFFDKILFVTNTNLVITCRKKNGKIKYGIFYVTNNETELYNEYDSLKKLKADLKTATA